MGVRKYPGTKYILRRPRGDISACNVSERPTQSSMNDRILVNATKQVQLTSNGELRGRVKACIWD